MFAARNSFMAGRVIEKDASFSSVVALLHGDGANGTSTMTDSSSSAANWTAYGNTQLTTSVKKFGTASISVDAASTTYLLSPSSTNLQFSTGAFTVELWFNLNSTANNPTIFDWRPDGTDNAGPCVMIGEVGSGRLGYRISSSNVISGSTTLSTGTWYHLAVSRASGVTKMFLNGVQEGSSYTDGNSYSNSQATFGAIGFLRSLTSYKVNGYFDDIRVTKGVGRYTTTFTPPTAAFPDA